MEKVFGEGKVKVNQLITKFKCEINVTEENNEVFVRVSGSKQAVGRASNEIHKLITSAYKGIQWNYFIAANCSTDENFNKGIEKYLKMVSNESKLDDLAFDNIYRLHITLMELILSNDYEIEKVGKIMKSTVSEFNWNLGNSFEVTGIKTFNDGSGKPRIFYGEPENSDEMKLLHKLQHCLEKNLKNEGIYIHDVSSVFHITVCRNTWFIKRNSWGSSSQLAKSASFKLPNAPIKTITLCKRYVWKPKNYWFVPASQDLNCLDI